MGLAVAAAAAAAAKQTQGQQKAAPVSLGSKIRAGLRSLLKPGKKKSKQQKGH
jgi:hypothetical protein